MLSFTHHIGNLPQEFLGNRSFAPVATEAEKVFGWSTWKHNQSSIERLETVVWSDGKPLLLLALEVDAFNSEVLQVPQGRLYWLLNDDISWHETLTREVAHQLKQTLKQSGFDCVALRIFGHPPAALSLFQRAGFSFIVGNAWFYRRPNWPVIPYEIPLGTHFTHYQMTHQPIGGELLDALLAIADATVYPDRFSLDACFDQNLVARRFRKVVQNALEGKIANAATVAYVNNIPRAVVFFHTLFPTGSNDFAIVDSWFTVLIHPAIKQQGLGWTLLADNLCRIANGNAYWTFACALDNFGSFEGIRKSGARLGATAYDFHWRR